MDHTTTTTRPMAVHHVTDSHNVTTTWTNTYTVNLTYLGNITVHNVTNDTMVTTTEIPTQVPFYSVLYSPDTINSALLESALVELSRNSNRIAWNG